MAAMMREWARDENIWRRRASLRCQLGFKEDTDLALLYDCIGTCMGHREFFVQKAMGWLRRLVAALCRFGAVQPVGPQ